MAMEPKPIVAGVSDYFATISLVSIATALYLVRYDQKPNLQEEKQHYSKPLLITTAFLLPKPPPMFVIMRLLRLSNVCGS
jgi:hypothetical protein